MKDNNVILQKIKKIVLEKDASAKVYLYGSRARGTMKEDSDWDLLILLNRENITHAVESEITWPLYDLEIETGELISPMIYSEKEWNSKYKVTPFYAQVMKDSKLL